MGSFQKYQDQLLAKPKNWLVTGVAGFIGSNLLETLLLLNQNVVGLDDFSTGYQQNLDEVKLLVSSEQWSRFTFIEGDVRSLSDCQKACSGVDYVLHQAALGSVPRSIENPIATNEVNISGFLNMLVAARNANVASFVYAASSSTYGDHPGLPKVEEKIGKPLSPYAVTKYVDELYADVFSRCYAFNSIGLRYFNVFGKRQRPAGAYAAVIPRWASAMLNAQDIYINGDGGNSRDFCFIDNVIQANILAATTTNFDSINQVYNVAVGDRTTLNQLFFSLKEIMGKNKIYYTRDPIYVAPRSGDVLHSQASIEKAQTLLGYEPSKTVIEGLELAMPWYINSKQDLP